MYRNYFRLGSGGRSADEEQAPDEAVRHVYLGRWQLHASIEVGYRLPTFRPFIRKMNNLLPLIMCRDFPKSKLKSGFIGFFRV